MKGGEKYGKKKKTRLLPKRKNPRRKRPRKRRKK
jgi:hypothetical protein